ncbi:plasmid mobilization protein [Tunturiibacter gelidoferens]|uniref:Uncharacterized protein (DUF1778 family) n=1 Tax=Tunturiibacter lichenicola TaxID=2051959 RepID=A0A7Y9T531_9BACT|nr:hypothetical protein [Edaphobacter lichenicola]NYF54117.1 uncharacterized protein (DUF1778 family) [Edaphobacter lichenicola]
MAEEMGFGRRAMRRKSGTHRAKTIGARISGDEERELIEAADRTGKSVSEWAREVLLREARKTERDPVFTEIVATRMLLNLVLKHIACGEHLTEKMFSDVLTTVRTTKHKQALDMMQQYTSTDKKES